MIKYIIYSDGQFKLIFNDDVIVNINSQFNPDGLTEVVFDGKMIEIYYDDECQMWQADVYDGDIFINSPYMFVTI